VRVLKRKRIVGFKEKKIVYQLFFFFILQNLTENMKVDIKFSIFSQNLENLFLPKRDRDSKYIFFLNIFSFVIEFIFSFQN